MVALLGIVTTVRVLVDEPGLAIAVYAVIPIVLAAFWFGWTATLTTAAFAGALYVGTELADPTPALTGADLVIAATNRLVIYVLVAVVMLVQLDRERRLRSRVQRQDRELAELQVIREVLTPAVVPPRPGLELASAFLPAEGSVAGDFFLVAPGPDDSTTLVIGDVVGHGFEPARRATFARTVIATSAPFTSDPAQLLELANTALAEHHDDSWVTATCVNVTTDGRLRWACAGHMPPWLLDTGEELVGCRSGLPLGLTTEPLDITPGSCVLRPGSGFLLFTDGLNEAHPMQRPDRAAVDLFDEERVRVIVRSHSTRPVAEIVRTLTDAVAAFAGRTLADDLCILACRLVGIDVDAAGQAGASDAPRTGAATDATDPATSTS